MTIVRRATVVTVAACVPLALGVGTAQAAGSATVARGNTITILIDRPGDVTTANNEKGWGFIAGDDGGADVFVH